jgi:NAD(P)-dependent dehydrogenase (short-subunit alcohol dehydrogenase family)
VSAMANALDNRCAIITGASEGLGFEIASKYLQAGASVTICARNAKMLDAAASELRTLARPGRSVVAVPADVSKSGDVARLADTALSEFGRLDILVNNAGVAGPSGPIETVDWEEWLQALEINLLGAVLLSRAVVPHFKRVGRGKIIQLSGGGATNPLPMLSAYAASKAAVIRFVETLAEETRRYRIDVNSIAPGALNTRMLDEVLAAGPERVGRERYERLLQQKKDGGVPLSKGAELAVFLGCDLSNGITGKLLSAVWDPWQALPQHLEELNSTDIYTLRRIVPEDRHMGWGGGD